LPLATVRLKRDAEAVEPLDETGGLDHLIGVEEQDELAVAERLDSEPARVALPVELAAAAVVERGVPVPEQEVGQAGIVAGAPLEERRILGGAVEEAVADRNHDPTGECLQLAQAGSQERVLVRAVVDDDADAVAIHGEQPPNCRAAGSAAVTLSADPERA